MIGRAIRGSVAIGISITIAAFACGGKIDDSSQSQVNPRPIGEPSPTPLPTVGPIPGPGPGPSPSTAATDIADAYCSTFGNCCQSSGQPPIDIARCREVTAAAVSPRILRGGPAGSSQVKTCMAAITARVAVCGKEDVPWFAYDEVALFGPSSIQAACGPLIGMNAGSGGAPCSAKTPCTNGEVCAIDECALDPGLGASCPNFLCLDGLMCNEGAICSQPSLVGVGSKCSANEDCQLGLVCAKNQCESARSAPSLYRERHSPYRVGFDTCRVFQFL